ncbi:FecR family protein [Gaoshiqia sp. Z1-71]|uniref:FecR family protein n=1 Tax=Gaoshiqia hydrogeniformans TaxID=3290090 RepID=UPI003BF82434
MNKDQHKWELWAALLHGEAQKSETEALQDSDTEKELTALRRIYNSREKVVQLSQLKPADVAWCDLKGKLFSRNRWMELLKYAAVLIVSLLITGSIFYSYHFRQTAQDEYASISAPNGQISNVTLFDGTNVWLNAGSKLIYKHSFNQKNREVILDGEALFSVTKNEKIPFIVHAGSTQIKVHGTQFNVKAYANDLKIETVLVEGEVEFFSDKRSVFMKPGEQLLFTKNSGELVKNNVSTDEHTAWKSGKMYFHDETLLNLTRQLERWYEVKFIFSDEQIPRYRFSGVINKERSLEYTLNIIQDINKVKFEFDKEQIMVKNK